MRPIDPAKYPNLARYIEHREAIHKLKDKLAILGESAERIAAGVHGINWTQLLIERNQLMNQVGGPMHENLAERVDFVANKIAEHCADIGVTATAVPLPDWAAADLTETARGWSPLRPGGAQIGDEAPMEFRYCPEVIVATTESYPLRFDDGTHPMVTVDGYIETLLDLIDSMVILADNSPEMGEAELISKAIDSTGESSPGWQGMATLFAVQSAAVDQMIGRRPDLAGDFDWVHELGLEL